MIDTSALITEIIDAQRQLQRSLAEDRSNPLYHSTLTMSQLRLLLLLQCGGSTGGQELARAMGVSLATLTGIVDRMVAHGLVTRNEDPRDRRVRRIGLTPEGTRLADSIVTAGTQRLRERLARIAPEDLELVRTALRLLCAAAPPDHEPASAEPVARTAPAHRSRAAEPATQPATQPATPQRTVDPTAPVPARRPRAARAGRG
jgi:DNA-binding MarR family transcriptional regulator